MKIVIVGPGAIGCLFASFLTEAEYDVVLVDKDPERARVISKQGILLEQNGRTRNVRMPATAAPAEIGTADFVCFCVKSFDTRSAIQHAAPLIGTRTTVVSIQNGIGNAEILAEQVSADRIVCAVTSQGSTSIGIGHVRHEGRGLTAVAPFLSPKSDAPAFARILRKAGVASEARNDAAAMIWDKLIVNAAVNPVTAIWNISNGEILNRPELAETAFAAAREAVAVAHAKGIATTFADAAEEVERICRATALNVSSMLQDVRLGRRTEIDAINGAIVREARKTKVPVPVNRMLLEKARKIGQAKRKAR